MLKLMGNFTLKIFVYLNLCGMQRDGSPQASVYSMLGRRCKHDVLSPNTQVKGYSITVLSPNTQVKGYSKTSTAQGGIQTWATQFNGKLLYHVGVNACVYTLYISLQHIPQLIWFGTESTWKYSVLRAHVAYQMLKGAETSENSVPTKIWKHNSMIFPWFFMINNVISMTI